MLSGRKQNCPRSQGCSRVQSSAANCRLEERPRKASEDRASYVEPHQQGTAHLSTLGQAGPLGALPRVLPAHCPVPIVMLPGWGTVLLSKVFSRAATPNSFRSRSSKADSRDREIGV